LGQNVPDSTRRKSKIIGPTLPINPPNQQEPLIEGSFPPQNVRLNFYLKLTEITQSKKKYDYKELEQRLKN